MSKVLSEKEQKLYFKISGSCRCIGCKKSPQNGYLCLFNKCLKKFSEINSNDVGCFVMHDHSISGYTVRLAFNNCYHCIKIFKSFYNMGYMPSVQYQLKKIIAVCPLDQDSCNLVAEYALNSFNPIWWMSQFSNIGIRVHCIYLKHIIEYSNVLPINFKEILRYPKIQKFKEPMYCSHIPFPKIIEPLKFETKHHKVLYIMIPICARKIQDNVIGIWDIIYPLLLDIFKFFPNCKSFFKCLDQIMSIRNQIEIICIIKEYFTKSKEFFNVLDTHMVIKVIDMIVQELFKGTVLENIPEIILKLFEDVGCNYLSKLYPKKCAMCKKTS
jgi:hypothetical protein